MPKPFPFRLAVGTDICSVARIRKILGNGRLDGSANDSGKDLDKGPWFARRFVERVLNVRERELYQHRLKDLAGPVAQSGAGPKGVFVHEGLALFLAGRWAAKEATIKAYTARRLFMHDITIEPSKDEDGNSLSPYAYVTAANGRPEDAEEVKISISHDGEYATAVCLAAAPPPGEDSSSSLKPTLPTGELKLALSQAEDQSPRKPRKRLSRKGRRNRLEIALRNARQALGYNIDLETIDLRNYYPETAEIRVADKVAEAWEKMDRKGEEPDYKIVARRLWSNSSKPWGYDIVRLDLPRDEDQVQQERPAAVAGETARNAFESQKTAYKDIARRLWLQNRERLTPASSLGSEGVQTDRQDSDPQSQFWTNADALLQYADQADMEILMKDSAGAQGATGNEGYHEGDEADDLDDEEYRKELMSLTEDGDKEDYKDSKDSKP